MKKRILSLVLLCAMLLLVALTCVSCGEQSKINKAMEKTRALSYLDADLLMDLSVEVSDKERTGTNNNKPIYAEEWDSQGYQMVYKILEATLESGEVLASEVGGWHGSGETTKSTYYDNGYVYLPSKVKQEIGEYKKYNTYYADLVRALLGDLPSQIFVEDENGNKMVTIDEVSGVTFVSESFDTKTKEQLSALEKIASPLLEMIVERVAEYVVCATCRDGKNSCAACGEKASDCSDCALMRTNCKTCQISLAEYYGKGKIERKIENGYVTESYLEFSVEINVGEDKVFVEGKIKAVINNPGQEVGIKFPYEYEKYPLVAVGKRPTIMDLIK